jgi:hypothetical protein
MLTERLVARMLETARALRGDYRVGVQLTDAEQFSVVQQLALLDAQAQILRAQVLQAMELVVRATAATSGRSVQDVANELNHVARQAFDGEREWVRGQISDVDRERAAS